MDWRAAVREGVYPIAFAARLAGTSNATAASWFRASRQSRLPPAILTPFESVRGQRLVPFLALVEARFVARFRGHGLSLQTIRKVAQKLRADYGMQHPFAKKSFRTDGKKVMMEEALDDGERRLLDIMTDEFGFADVIEQSLFDTVVYIDDIVAKLQPFEEMSQVFIDPRYALGRPFVTPGYVPTDAVAAAYLAEGSIEAVAEWFGTDATAVSQAVAFEQRLQA